MEYKTKDGDMLDAICFNYYGHLRGTVEQVLEENQGLAKHGLILPQGITINLPEIKTQEKISEEIQLWD